MESEDSTWWEQRKRRLRHMKASAGRKKERNIHHFPVIAILSIFNLLIFFTHLISSTKPKLLFLFFFSYFRLTRDPASNPASPPLHFQSKELGNSCSFFPFQVPEAPFFEAYIGKDDSPKSVWTPETKLEAKMVEAMQRRESHGSSVKSFNTIILKFPKIDESFRKCKAIFEQFDEDSNGAIDKEELKKSFSKLEISLPEEEVNDLFEACDINDDLGMEFSEFIVLLCLVHLLKDDPAAVHTKSRIGMPNLEATFETLVDTFVFLDKNRDGYVSKSEMVQAINETVSGERSSGRIAMKRFEEMDWDKNGMVNFKEFLFAFTSWVGIEDE